MPGSMPSAAIVNCCGLLTLFPHHQAAGAKAESFSLFYSPRIRQSSLGACSVNAETNAVGSRKNKGRFSPVSTVEQFLDLRGLFLSSQAQFNESKKANFSFFPFPSLPVSFLPPPLPGSPIPEGQAPSLFFCRYH